jgi:hypothetical protein
MFFDQFNEVGIILLAVENFSFPELYIFLKIIGGGFRNTKILHGFGYLDPHLLANPEIMINCIAGSENYGSVIHYVHFILPEIFGRNSVNSEEFAEGDIDVEFSSDLSIR